MFSRNKAKSQWNPAQSQRRNKAKGQLTAKTPRVSILQTWERILEKQIELTIGEIR